MLQKISYLFILLTIPFALFAATGDLDNDGIVDSIDLCPDVIGVRGLDGCPRVDIYTDDISISTEHLSYACYEEIISEISYFSGTKSCSDESCPHIEQGAGLQKCDIIFPVILNFL